MCEIQNIFLFTAPKGVGGEVLQEKKYEPLEIPL